MRTLVITAALAALTSLPGQAAADTCGWQSSYLELPKGAVTGQVFAADGDGWFAGEVTDANRSDTPMRWRHTAMEELGLAFGGPTLASGISPTGVVVGLYVDNAPNARAVRYRTDRWELIPSTAPASEALDVNARGDIVGREYDTLGNTDLVVWSADGTIPTRRLSVPAGETPSVGGRIDDDGSVVAMTEYIKGADVRFTPHVWLPDGTRITLQQREPGGSATVTDIRGGRIVGGTFGAEGWMATEWDRTGRIVRTFPPTSGMTAVNTAGLIVGEDATGASVVWHPDGTVDQLPGPGGKFGVRAINDSQIGGGDGRPMRWERTC